MNYFQRDFSIFKKMDFDRPPVAVKLEMDKPEGIKALDKRLGLCECIREAQEGTPFYYSQENETCSGDFALGMVEPEGFFKAGELGPNLEIFKEPRANRRIYHYLPRLNSGSVRYVIHSPLDKVTSFDPDLIIFTCKTFQAELLFRARAYTTGMPWTAKGQEVLGCAWIYAYPIISGDMNMSATGLCWGIKAREVLPEGYIIISMPWNMIPMIIENLNDMPWVPPSYAEGRDKYDERCAREIRQLIEKYGQKADSRIMQDK